MNKIIPWLCVAVFAAGTVYFYLADNKKAQELALLRPQAQEAETLHAELETARTAAAAQTEALAQSKKDSEDSLRLRNEVRQLKEDKLQLDKQLQTAQKASASALQQAQQQTEQLKATAQRLQSAARQSEETAQRNTCIGQLRMIDGAMQQWALEQNKPGTATPTVQDISPYLKNGVLPVCPASGTYVLGMVEGVPTCSIAGHVMPAPAPPPATPEAPTTQ